ncbi:MAG TPA: ceramidase domain-containing protein [Methylomirabilota bacterium]|nr:ceramidase domain-containing protein [Methylomirabilota bacterium]
MHIHYCERGGTGLFDEPLNAVTNGSFFIAVWLTWRHGKREDALSPGLWVLIALSIAVGIGSTLWHTLATPWAQLLDVTPILLFQLCFLWLYGRGRVGLRWEVVAPLLVLYVAAALWGRQHREWLNGILAYTPALVLSLVVGLDHYLRSRREPFLVLAAAAVFCLSLFFRTIDLAVCRSLPVGTHFLWHTLNGVVLFLLMRTVIVSSSRAAGADELSSRVLN